jgi:hypothetical protein
MMTVLYHTISWYSMTISLNFMQSNCDRKAVAKLGGALAENPIRLASEPRKEPSINTRFGVGESGRGMTHKRLI